MGRPIGSVNREKPFTDALRVALLSGGRRHTGHSRDRGSIGRQASAGHRTRRSPVGGDDRSAAIRDHSERAVRAYR